MLKIKNYISKINENIDKAEELRNKMFFKFIGSIFLIITCYFAHSYETMEWLLYIIQICSFFYAVYTGFVAGFITYIRLVVGSKVEAVSFGKGVGKVVVDQVRDTAVDKIRNVKK